MPALVGAFKAVSVGGVLQIGDVPVIAPKSVSKTYAGSGTFNTGDGGRTVNPISSTNTVDQDVNDSNVTSGY